ncbi:DNA ligase [Actinotalea sp. Marseille-Q4924]|uniref:ATP-dependent DNA ligase n=1 Tax=Actinotalea sp. Marseille-Q4924 TaxID=2866571 RepID=UPI00351CFAF2
MLATRAAPGAAPGTPLPRGADWVYEVKWDGVRVLADTTGDRLRLWARSGREVTAAYPELAGLAAVQGAVLDGEVVVMAGGVPSFEALAERMHVRDPARAQRLAARLPATYMVFDVMVLYGVDLTRSPWQERRGTLERLALPDRAQLSPVYDDADALWEVTLEHGLEGVVAKRRTSTYQPGRRSPDWVKAPHRASRAAAVVGWRPETGASGVPAAGRGRTTAPGARLGAVLLAAPQEDGTWRYLGKAGSGLAGRRGEDLARVLRPLTRSEPVLEPDDVPAADARGAVWCDPAVVVDVAYLHRTRTGRLRHPVVRGRRTDVVVDPWEAP